MPTVTLTNVTLTGNSAFRFGSDAVGAGIFNQPEAEIGDGIFILAGLVKAKNTILAANTATIIVDIAAQAVELRRCRSGL